MTVSPRAHALAPQQSPVRRRVIVIAMLLLLGAATTIAIAIAIAIAAAGALTARAPSAEAWSRFGERTATPGSSEGAGRLEFKSYDRWGASFAYTRIIAQSGTVWPNSPPPEAAAHRWERTNLFPWLDGRAPWPSTGEQPSMAVKSAGWPLPVLWCEITRTSSVQKSPAGVPIAASHTYEAPGGLVLSGGPQSGFADWPPIYPTIVPLRPIWPEFLACTLLYAVPWLVAIRAVRVARRWSRARRGLCPACGYSRAGLGATAPCPECGARRGDGRADRCVAGRVERSILATPQDPTSLPRASPHRLWH